MTATEPLEIRINLDVCMHVPDQRFDETLHTLQTTASSPEQGQSWYGNRQVDMR